MKKKEAKDSRTPITQYDYINFLVDKVKTSIDNKEEYEEYFNELRELYSPLLKSIVLRVSKEKNSDITFEDIQARVLECFFELIKRYEPKYTKRGSKAKGKAKFTRVYFSRFIARGMVWEIYRLLCPSNKEYDEFSPEPEHQSINFGLHKGKDKSIIYIPKPVGITENFINTCSHLNEIYKNDIMGDICMLHFGYSYKPTEISRIIKLPCKSIEEAIKLMLEYLKNNPSILTN